MESNKFYAECWKKAKKDISKATLNYKIDDTKEERLKVIFAENIYQYLIDVETEVKAEV